MGGDKGGGYDTGPMLEYGDKALALQKEQYDYSKQVSQPWLNTGTSAINKLSTMMGLTGGETESRQSIYDRLAPQYTTQQTQSSGYYIDPRTGAMIAPEGVAAAARGILEGWRIGSVPSTAERNRRAMIGQKTGEDLYSALGFKKAETTSPTVDTNALNAAVDAAYSAQTPGADFGKLLQTYTGQDIYNDPSYAFRLGQGQKAMERQLAASGKYLTPAASMALQEYGQNMGSQEYMNAYNRFNQDQSNLYNRLANLSGMGQTQTGQVIGAGNAYANAGSDIYTGMGNAITAANQAKAANSGSMFNTLLGAGGNMLGSWLGTEAGSAAVAAMFSDENLKQDIKLVGQENGHNVYEFAYKTDPSKKYIGVMAQEVQKTNPDAVHEIDGYLAVDYDKIGVKFREV